MKKIWTLFIDGQNRQTVIAAQFIAVFQCSEQQLLVTLKEIRALTEVKMVPAPVVVVVVVVVIDQML